MSGTFTDPALGVQSETFTGTAAWSDGATSLVNVNSAEGTFTTTRIFADDHPQTATALDTFTVDVTITDDDGGSVAATSPVVTVENTPPVIGGITASETQMLHSLTFTDPIGDQTFIDVTEMVLSWVPDTGEYTILLTADPAHPFMDNFRINLNLFNPDTGTTAQNPAFFQDAVNDFSLSTPQAAILLTGTNPRLVSWDPGDRVATNSTPFGNFDGTSLFRSSVNSLPFDSGNEDTIAAGNTFSTVQNIPGSPGGGQGEPGTPITVNEGESVTISGSFADAALGEPTETFTGAAVWSDGVETPVTVDSANGTFSTSRTFADDDPATGTVSDDFTVDVTITDDDGGSHTVTSPVVTVNNVAPTIADVQVSANSIFEPDTVTVNGTFTDPALGVASETFTGTVLWSDGAVTAITVDSQNGTFSTSRTFADDHPGTGTPFDTFTVDVTITDDDGGSATITSPVVTVNNVSPTVALNPVAMIDENGTATLTGSYTDAGTLDEHDVTVEWDDPNNATDSVFAVSAIADLSVDETFNSADGAVLTITALTADTVSFSVEHQYLDDGAASGNGTASDTSTIKVTVFDDDGGSGDSTTTVLVDNVDPEIEGLTVATTFYGVGNEFDEKLDKVFFTWDVSDAGSLDTFEYTINFGDGTVVSGVAIDGTGSGSVVETHRYFTIDNQTTTYTVTVSVVDDDGGQTQESFDVIVRPLASIEGQKFEDLDGDGVRRGTEDLDGDGQLDPDEDSNANGVLDREEWGLDDWTIHLRDGNGNILQSTVTFGIDLNQDGEIDRTERGYYKFIDVRPGTNVVGAEIGAVNDSRRQYFVNEVLQPGWEQVHPDLPQEFFADLNATVGVHEFSQNVGTVILEAAEATGVDFGNRGTAEISGVKFEDINGDGVQAGFFNEDGDFIEENGIAGVEVQILDSEGDVLGRTLTDEYGGWSISGIAPGGTHTRNTDVSYRAVEVLYPFGVFEGSVGAGVVQTAPDTDNPLYQTAENFRTAGTGFSTASTIIGVGGTHLFPILGLAGQTLTLDVNAQSIGSRLDASLTILNPDNSILATVDDEFVVNADGNLIRRSLDPILEDVVLPEFGVYFVVVGAVRESGRYDLSIIGDATLGYGRMVHNFTVDGGNVSGLDFGNQPADVALPPGRIEGRIFEDPNGNATFDENIAVAGATVTLTRDQNRDGVADADEESVVVTTDVDGRYVARNLAAGSWIVATDLGPAKWEFTGEQGATRTIEVAAGKLYAGVDVGGRLRDDVDLQNSVALNFGPANASGVSQVASGLTGTSLGTFNAGDRLLNFIAPFNVQTLGDTDSYVLTIPIDVEVAAGETLQLFVRANPTDPNFKAQIVVEERNGLGEFDERARVNRSGETTRVQLPAAAGKTYRISVRSAGDFKSTVDDGRGTLTIRAFIEVGDDFGSDPAAAPQVALNQRQVGQFHTVATTDADVFRFVNGPETQKLRIVDGGGNAIDPTSLSVSVRNAAGEVLVLTGSTPVFVAQASETYIITLQGRAPGVGLTTNYAFRVVEDVLDDSPDSDSAAVAPPAVVNELNGAPFEGDFTIEGLFDVDVIAFNAIAPGVITVEVEPIDGNQNIDPAIRVRTLSGDPAGSVQGRSLGFDAGELIDPADPNPDFSRKVVFEATSANFQFVVDLRGQGALAEGRVKLTVTRTDRDGANDPDLIASDDVPELNVGPTGDALYEDSVLGANPAIPDRDEFRITNAGGSVTDRNDATVAVAATAGSFTADAQVLVIRESDNIQIASANVSGSGGDVTFRTFKGETYRVIVVDSGLTAQPGGTPVAYDVSVTTQVSFENSGTGFDGFAADDLQDVELETGQAVVSALAEQQQTGVENGLLVASAGLQAAIEAVQALSDGFTGLVLFFDPVDFIVEDPGGRQAGFTAGQGNVNEFDGQASFSGDGIVEVLVIPNASRGVYNLNLAGVGGQVRGGGAFVAGGGVSNAFTFAENLVKGNLSLSLDFSVAGGDSGVLVPETVAGLGTGDGGESVPTNANRLEFIAFTPATIDDFVNGSDSENESKELSPWEQIRQWLAAIGSNGRLFIDSAKEALDFSVFEKLLPEDLRDDSDPGATHERFKSLKKLLKSELSRNLFGASSDFYEDFGKFLKQWLPEELFSDESELEDEPDEQSQEEIVLRERPEDYDWALVDWPAIDGAAEEKDAPEDRFAMPLETDGPWAVDAAAHGQAVLEAAGIIAFPEAALTVEDGGSPEETL